MAPLDINWFSGGEIDGGVGIYGVKSMGVPLMETAHPAISPDTAAKNSTFACAVPVEPQNMLHDLANLANL